MCVILICLLVFSMVLPSLSYLLSGPLPRDDAHLLPHTIFVQYDHHQPGVCLITIGSEGQIFTFPSHVHHKPGRGKKISEKLISCPVVNEQANSVIRSTDEVHALNPVNTVKKHEVCTVKFSKASVCKCGDAEHFWES